MKTFNTAKKNNITVLHNNKKGNNYIVASILSEHLQCNMIASEDNPKIHQYDTIIFVVSNYGDEELCQPMEDYIYNIKIKNKKFLICELGNYFGFENYIGCKKIVIKLLENLNWQKISDISIDSLPKIDLESLNNWILEIKYKL